MRVKTNASVYNFKRNVKLTCTCQVCFDFTENNFNICKAQLSMKYVFTGKSIGRKSQLPVKASER